MHYSDGSTQQFTQNLSDWLTPSEFSGKAVVASTEYTNTYVGGRSGQTAYIYGYSFSLDSSKTVVSITLPDDGQVNLLAITMVDATGGPQLDLPGEQFGQQATPVAFYNGLGSGMSLADPSADGGDDQLTLSVGHGELSLAESQGLTFVSGAQDGSPSLTVTGSLADLNAALSVLLYTPDSGFSGDDTLNVTLTNPTTSTSATGAVTISLAANAGAVSPPALVDMSFMAVEGTALSEAAAQGVLKVEGSAAAALTAAVVAEPSHGSLTMNADGSFVYTPDAGYTGDDSFTFDATAGGLTSNTATASIDVVAPAAPPVAENDAYSTSGVAAGGSLVVGALLGVLANDQIAAGRTGAASVVAEPSDGALTLNSDGSFSYTPGVDYAGADSFTYEVGDGTGDSNVATVTLTSRPAPRPPASRT